MNWVLMVGTLMGQPTDVPLPVQWKAYSVQSMQGCKDKLAEVRNRATYRANCHEQAVSKVYPLVMDGQDVAQ